MKFTSARDSFIATIRPIIRTIPNKYQRPTDAWLLIDSLGDQLTITGGPPECQMQATLQTEVHQDGTIAVDAKSFMELLSNLNDPNVELEIQPNVDPQNAVHPDHLGSIMITSGNAVSWFNTMNNTAFITRPTLDPPDRSNSIILDGEALQNALAKVMMTALPNEARPEFFSVNIRSQENYAVFASSDAIRLTVYRVPILEGVRPNMDITIPADTMRHLRDVITADPVTVVFSDDGYAIEFITPTYRISSTVMATMYPDYANFASQVYQFTFEMDHRDFQQVIASTIAFSHQEMPTVTLSPTSDSNNGLDMPVLQLHCNHHEVGSLENATPIRSAQGDPRDVDIAFSYMRDISRVKWGDEIRISIPPEGAPINFSIPDNPDFYHLVVAVKPN